MTRLTSEQVKSTLNGIRALPLVAQIIGKLSQALPDDLHYHSLEHTENVIEEVVLLALTEGLPLRAVQLLAIAAAYHDAGFVFRREQNEVLGAALAAEAIREKRELPNDSLISDSEIELIQQMILDTALVDNGKGRRQIPRTPLSPYLLDADLANLGRDDFFERLELQLRERGGDRIDFMRNTLRLLLDHDWHTEAARRLRQAQKEENVKQLRHTLARELAAA